MVNLKVCSYFEGREGNLSRERRRRTGMEMRVLHQIPKATLPISKRRHYGRQFGTHVDISGWKSYDNTEVNV